MVDLEILHQLCSENSRSLSNFGPCSSGWREFVASLHHQQMRCDRRNAMQRAHCLLLQLQL